MKTVFSGREVPHIWAAQSQHEGRNSGGSLYFRDSTIFSYRDSAPLARIFEHKGKRGVFITSRSYSITTTKHTSWVRQAVNHLERIYVKDPLLSIPEQRKALLADIQAARQELGQCVNSRSLPKLAGQVASAVSSYNRFAEFFGYAKQSLTDSESAILDKSKEAIEAWKAGNADRIKAAHAKAKREAAKRRREEAERLEKWRRGEYVPGLNSYRYAVALRIKGEDIETTMGARFPLEHARRVMGLVKTILERGETYARNGHTIHLGPYAIDSIDAEGTLTAGCHVVGKDEVLRLIAELERLPQGV